MDIEARSQQRAGTMKSFRGRLAVVTGGSTGMGRELTTQLAAEGCHVAIANEGSYARSRVSRTDRSRTRASSPTEVA
jgi:NAD(P)-dependent dehydrogenase (short-subunit alcohol dehydrogenase family)